MTDTGPYDVVIIGGGLYGCSTAYHLLSREPHLKVVIVEPDTKYEHAASARSNGGVRVLFSQAESIYMSQYGHEFYSNFEALMSTQTESAQLDCFRNGYLLLGTQPHHVDDMMENLKLQHALGCNVEVHDAAGIQSVRPHLNTEDVQIAIFSPDDMWIDPYSAVTGMLRKVRDMGVTLIRGRVQGFEQGHGRIHSINLDDESRLDGSWFVNCCGAWAPQLCEQAGFSVPVEPLPMMVYYFETPALEHNFGVTIDIETVSFRPEGRGFISINRRLGLQGNFHWETDPDLFEADNWPKLAHRVPHFESLKVRSSYCCHYANNTFDGNLLLGAWPGAAENLLIATGASGHGLQHAPAAGRGLSELILDGRFSNIDLARFGCRRVVDNRPDPERGFRA